ncbi:MAG: hypothetical protein AABW88_02265 [Nanoarchaeota archaeon]
MHSTETKEIARCDSCCGHGSMKRSKLIHPHNGEYEYWMEECRNCQGSGLIEIITIHSIEIKPWKPYKASLIYGTS